MGGFPLHLLHFSYCTANNVCNTDKYSYAHTLNGTSRSCGVDEHQVVSFLPEGSATVLSGNISHHDGTILVSQCAADFILHLHLQVSLVEPVEKERTVIKQNKKLKKFTAKFRISDFIVFVVDRETCSNRSKLNMFLVINQSVGKCKSKMKVSKMGYGLTHIFQIITWTMCRTLTNRPAYPSTGFTELLSA